MSGGKTSSAPRSRNKLMGHQVNEDRATRHGRCREHGKYLWNKTPFENWEQQEVAGKTGRIMNTRNVSKTEWHFRQAGKQQTKFGLCLELTIRQVINKQLLYNWICFWFVGIFSPTRRQDFSSVQEIAGDRSRHVVRTHLSWENDESQWKARKEIAIYLHRFGVKRRTLLVAQSWNSASVQDQQSLFFINWLG